MFVPLTVALNVPVFVPFKSRFNVLGETVTLVTVAAEGLTVTVHVLEMLLSSSDVAVIVAVPDVVPGETVMLLPVCAEIVATLELDVVQLTVLFVALSGLIVAARDWP